MRIVDLTEALDLDTVDTLLPLVAGETEVSQSIVDIVAGVRNGG